MIKTKLFERGHDHYVFPSQCEQVFYSNVPGERDLAFVVRYDPRGRPIKYTHVQEEYHIEEEDDSPDQTESEYHTRSTDKEDEEYHDPDVGDNAILDNDVDENMLENDIDDDDDIVNPLNTISEPDDYTDVKFYEEEDTE
jgi:hypothetical protein